MPTIRETKGIQQLAAATRFLRSEIGVNIGNIDAESAKALKLRIQQQIEDIQIVVRALERKAEGSQDILSKSQKVNDLDERGVVNAIHQYHPADVSDFDCGDSDTAKKLIKKYGLD